jgi:hypothetical protein
VRAFGIGRPIGKVFAEFLTAEAAEGREEEEEEGRKSHHVATIVVSVGP